jgi:dUTP pyrophosphatase
VDLDIKIKKLRKEAVIPTYAHEDDAGADLFAVRDVVLNPNEQVQIETGLAFDIPKGYVMFIWDKSGLSQKHGIKTLGGVVDSGYRGEVKVGLINLSSKEYVVKKHHKVAQMIIQKREKANFIEVDGMSDSLRGSGGFGSTGK